MIELKNVDKYFNKKKIHVINNTSLSIKEPGLVALLGESGSGKTTLLNVIGGLDNIKRGTIYVNNNKISSKFSHKVDKIRNLNIGYIFQDYKLVENLSVYDNLKLVLTMIGLKNKKEIDKRINYVLEKVDMLRFKKRPASMLSGGQRQRVAIARALVKNPSIILADEPTGNLDSKNSLEIMKIIKAISKEKIVILVTHEENLATFYSDRIIKIQDGKVLSDEKNNHENELEYAMDNNFYLKDFKNKEQLNKNITLYSDKKENVKIDIVIKNNNIYIKTDNKTEIVDETSSIEFIDDHFKKISKKDILKYNFNYEEIIDDNFKKKYSSIFNTLTLISSGFKKIMDMTILRKILLLGFFISGLFITYAYSSYIATTVIKDKKFVQTNKNYLSVELKNTKVNDFLNFEKEEDIYYILPGNSIVTFKVKYDNYYQTSTTTDDLSGSLSSINMITKENIYKGRMPQNNQEIVVDKLTIERMFKEGIAKQAGYKQPSDLLEKEVTINDMLPFKIVGITNMQSPSIYVYDSEFHNIISNSLKDNPPTLIDYNLVKDKIKIVKGREPSNDYETIVNESNKEEMPLNKEINQKVNDKKLKVVGYYTSSIEIEKNIVNNNLIKYNNIDKLNNLTIYSKDKNKTLKNYKEKQFNIDNSYEKDKKNYIKENKSKVKGIIIVSIVILSISLIEIYLIIRASFLSRIKEVGIYRAIGVKKTDIYKMFISEIFAITTIATVPGIILMSYILKQLSYISYLEDAFLITIPIVFIIIIFMYLFNILVGLLPVFNVIRKTPSSILARYDAD